MAKLPPRRVLRGVLNDAISDRNEFVDANRPRFGQPDAEAAKLIEMTRGQIARYEELEKRLSDPRPLTAEDHATLSMSVHHARIWRITLLDSWKGTGDKANLLACRQDIARLEKVEAALGVTPHFTVGGPDPEGSELVDIFEISRRYKAQEAS